jgi:hypothetical protein
MTDADFLQYNHSELGELARLGNKAQRMWLKSSLMKYALDSERQQKLAVLIRQQVNQKCLS